MASLSNGEAFFRSIPAPDQEAFEFLSRLISDPNALENDWRDYKEAAHIPNKPKWKEETAAIWSENISAFANTSGGVVVWGLDENREIPSKLSLTPNCVDLRQYLIGVIHDAVDPYVSGIEIRAIVRSSNDPTGFVVCYIPPSPHRPHRAQIGERTFFIRVQNSNVPCPTSLLRNLFHPRIVPRMHAKLNFLFSLEGTVTISVKIANLGPGSAQDLIVALLPEGMRNPRFQRDAAIWIPISGTNVAKYPHTLPPNFVLELPLDIYGVTQGIEGPLKLRINMFIHNSPMQYVDAEISDAEAGAAAHSRRSIQRDFNAKFIDV